MSAFDQYRAAVQDAADAEKAVEAADAAFKAAKAARSAAQTAVGDAIRAVELAKVELDTEILNAA